MPVEVRLVITLAVGLAGGLLLLRLKVPAGMLVGAIIAAAAFSVLTGAAAATSFEKLCAQIITGAYIGASISKEDIVKLPRVLRPYLTVMGFFLVLNMVSGVIIHLISPMDLLTSLLCAMPGGMSDTPLIAMDMGADSTKVALLQFVRMIYGVSCLPALIVLADKFINKNEVKIAEVAAAPKRSEREKRPLAPLFITFAVAAAAGFAGKLIGIPAGALVFSMLFAVALKMLMPSAYLPLWFRRLAQVLSGCCIGSQMTRADILELRYLLLPALILLVGYTINCVGMGFLLHWRFKLSHREGMLCASPAGATEMALIAADLGVDSPDLIVLQIARLVGVLSIFPQIIGLVVSAFG